MAGLKIMFIICAVLATGIKLYQGSPMNDWLWPVCAALWCLSA